MASGEITGLYDFSDLIRREQKRAEEVRFIPRTSVVLNVVDSYGQAFVALCAKRPKDSDDFSTEESFAVRDPKVGTPRNWEWPGGKVDNGVEGSGAKRQFARLPILTVMQAALREVGEELQVTNGHLHYIERMPWQWAMGSEKIVDNEKNVYIMNHAFRGTAWVNSVLPIPPSDEHFGGIWIQALDFRDDSLRDRVRPREQIQCLSAQLNSKRLYVRRTGVRQDVFEFVTNYKDRDLLDKALEAQQAIPDDFLVLPLNDSSALVGKQYFWSLFHQNYII